MKTKSIAICIALATFAASAHADKIPDFRLPARTFFAQSNAPTTKKVFAWYMMCCGAFGGNNGTLQEQVAEYKAEIQMARSMGIDGFGLDMMEPNDAYHTAATAMFQAASQVSPDFKLFFELDHGMPDPSKTDYVAMVMKYHDHPNYFRVGGLPLVGAYGADCGLTPVSASVEWWRTNVVKPLAEAGIPIYFVPTTFGQFGSPTQEVAAWDDVAQGQSVWQIQLSPIGGGLETLQRDAAALHLAHKTCMSTVATHYWVGAGFSIPLSWYWMPGQPATAKNPNGHYFEHAGGLGLAQQWESVVNIQKPEWVMMLTWNDFNESYIEPIDDYKKYKNGTGDAPLGWYKPQVGLDELNRYYIQWYKTGVQPRITADSIFYAYRTCSAHLTASLDPRAPVAGGNGPVADTLFVTTALTAPAELQIASGGITTKHVVAAGIHHTLVPFQVGKQTFSLWRNGVRILSVTGKPVVDSIKFYDYWPTTGYGEFLVEHVHTK